VLLDQIIANLLDNSAKYSDPDKVIKLRLESKGGTAILTVVDQGWGIPKEEIVHICEPFYRASQARWTGRPGVGLGLAIVQRLIKAVGAHLQIESEIGSGSRFRITFPLSANSDRRESIQQSADNALPEHLQYNG
jgi:signal transduction histidine kinase